MSVHSKMTAIADAIRGKTGGTNPLTLDQMATAIAEIQTGGGGGDNTLLESIVMGTATSVSLGEQVTTIKDHLFENVTTLKEFDFSHIQAIRTEAFKGCTSLKSITIPDGVAEIGGSAFYGCTSLKEVYCKPTTPPAGSRYMFDKSYPIIYVPRNSVEAYKAAQYWSDYASYIVEHDF